MSRRNDKPSGLIVMGGMQGSNMVVKNKSMGDVNLAFKTEEAKNNWIKRNKKEIKETKGNKFIFKNGVTVNTLIKK